MVGHEQVGTHTCITNRKRVLTDALRKIAALSLQLSLYQVPRRVNRRRQGFIATRRMCFCVPWGGFEDADTTLLQMDPLQVTELAYADERAALAAVTADGYKLGEPGGTGRKRPRRGGVGGRKKPVTSGPRDAPMRPTMSSFRRFGGIGILILDATPPPRVVAANYDTIAYSRNSLSAAYRPLRTSQWALLERAQRAEHVVALVICCDRPLFPEPVQWAQDGGHSDQPADIDRAVIEATRVYESHLEVLRLLDTLFEWLSFPAGKYQTRSVQLLCGIRLCRGELRCTSFENINLRRLSIELQDRDS